jgi:hypothetical protein
MLYKEKEKRHDTWCNCFTIFAKYEVALPLPITFLKMYNLCKKMNCFTLTSTTQLQTESIFHDAKS